MPAATSPLPAAAVRGVNVRQRLPVISRPTRRLRILGPSELASVFTRIKAKLLAAGPDELDMPPARRQIPSPSDGIMEVRGPCYGTAAIDATVESRMGAVAWAMRQRSVSHPRSSNRTCPIKASGLYGSFFVKGASRHFCRALLLHSFVRPAPRAFFHPDRTLPPPSRAVAVKDGASSAPPKACP